MAVGVNTAVYTSCPLLFTPTWVKAPRLPPLTSMSPAVKSLLASLRVKVMVAVCPAVRLAWLLLMAMVGAAVSLL